MSNGYSVIVTSLIQDIRFALRGFRGNRAFTLAAILSLAIGVGANTAIFSVVNALLLHPLPYKDADRLAILWNRSPGLNIAQDWFSTAQYFDVKNGHSGFEQVAIAIGAQYNLTSAGEPERVYAVRISSNLLPMLGAALAKGRLFLPEEDATGSAPVILLSHGFWERRYGSDPGMVGKSLVLNGKSFQITGILSRSFALPHEVLPTLYGGDQPDIFVSLPLAQEASNVRTAEDYNILGRLKSGVAVQQAQSEMNSLTARLVQDHPQFYPPNSGLTFSVVPLLDQVVGDIRLVLVVLQASVGIVLLIACANVANLLLSRAVARQREMAVRAALGASRWRILKQLLIESVTLASCGAALGVLLAFAGLKLVQGLGPASVPRIAEIGIDDRALMFTMAISLLSGILFGFAPAWRLSRLDLYENLKEGGRGSSGASSVWGRGHNMRRLLVVFELALSVVLLIAAGLLIRSLAHLKNVSPGFNPSNVLTFDLAGVKYAGNFYRDLWPRLDRLPSVTASGGISTIPFSTLWSWAPRTVEGRVPPPGENFLISDIRVVSGRYFEAMGIPLVKGRWFDDRDARDSLRVCIVDEYTARELWPNQDPIGKRTRGGRADSREPWDTVIGVVGRVKQYSLESDSHIAMYFPQSQYGGARTIVLRSTADPATLAVAAKQAIREMDPNVPLYNVQTMGHRLEGSLAQRRFAVLLLGLFSGLALILAVIGVYGVMSYLVTQGEREIGIRIALGATQSRILRWVVGQGAMVAAAGVGIGLAGAFAATRAMRALLYGVGTTDPLTFAAAACVLALVALAASYVPARRAARVDPMISLRCE